MLIFNLLKNHNSSISLFHNYSSKKCLNRFLLFSQHSTDLGNSSEHFNKFIESESKMSYGNQLRVLNVAEKNDASKRISGLLSNGTATIRNGPSVYNKIYQFKYTLWNRSASMSFTSVSGHLLGYDFSGENRKWANVEPLTLFEAPLVKSVTNPDMEKVKLNLEQEASRHTILIIWTDCDREGENIGYEVIDVCRAINPHLTVHRAKFSEITPSAVVRAIHNLVEPDKRVSDAVDVRQQLDLRIGAAFTRFQTMRLNRRFPALSDKLISYGSCQFPTLGFVVERYKAILNFIPETFWKIELSLTIDGIVVDFKWGRVRLFDREACLTIFDKCEENPIARVISVKSKPKSKWRPVALDTVEFEKLSSRKLKINAKEAMKIAEKLYTRGIISYPRTETNIFPPGLDLKRLVEQHTSDRNWGEFAQKVVHCGPTPRNGKKSDQAHPPIHPTKHETSLTGNEKKIYDLIVRHFLACLHKDAYGKETIAEVELAEEKFVAHGLRVIELNYLEVYIYEKWSEKELPEIIEGSVHTPTSLTMGEGETSPPNLLTEADLISLMEKHGIGTDATHAEHIETIKSRMYVGLEGDGRFVPGQLGMGLCEGYDSMGLLMSKPHLRAALELDLKRICEGTKDPNAVLQEQITNYRNVFIQATEQVNRLDAAIHRFVNNNNTQAPSGPPNNNNNNNRRPPGGGNFPNNNHHSNNNNNNDDDDDDNDFGPQPPQNPVFSRNQNSTSNNNNSNNRSQTNAFSQRAPSSNFQSSTSTFSSAQNYNFTSQRSNENSNFNIQRTTAQSAQNSSNFNNSNNFQNSDFSYSCPPPCSQNLQALTVRKESANKGRVFYSCQNCKHFKWQDEIESFKNRSSNSSSVGNFAQAQIPSTTQLPNNYHNNNLNSNQPGNNSAQNNNGGGIPNCNCNKQAVWRTVAKEGQNKGRHFFACPLDMADPTRCNFFSWDDEGIGAHLAKKTPKKPYSAGNKSFTGKKRKCGVCYQTGHNKKNCPMRRGGGGGNRSMDDDDIERMDED